MGKSFVTVSSPVLKGSSYRSVGEEWESQGNEGHKEKEALGADSKGGGGNTGEPVPLPRLTSVAITKPGPNGPRKFEHRFRKRVPRRGNFQRNRYPKTNR